MSQNLFQEPEHLAPDVGISRIDFTWFSIIQEFIGSDCLPLPSLISTSVSLIFKTILLSHHRDTGEVWMLKYKYIKMSLRGVLGGGALLNILADTLAWAGSRV